MRALAFRLRPRSVRPKIPFAPQLVAVLLVVGLAGAMAVEPTRRLLEQRDRIAGMESELHALERSNHRLAHRIKRLRNPDYVEQQARAIGLVRPGERSIVVMPEGGPAGRTPRHHRPEPAPAPPSFVEGMLAFLGL